MELRKLLGYCSIVLVLIAVAMPVMAQDQGKGKVKDPYTGIIGDAAKTVGPTTWYGNPLPERNAAGSTDWTNHNLDVGNSRFSTLDQIHTANARTLSTRWTFQTGNVAAGFNCTPLVADGIMYITDGQGSVYAADAETGVRLWKYNVANLIPGGEFGITNRGAAYGDGVVYVAAGPSLFAINAKTGQGLESFGPKGVSEILAAALKDKFPGKRPIQLGYALTMAPLFYKGVVYVGATLSERMIPGGLFFAVDGKTGKILWQFNTIPQGPTDEGWAIAKDTWVGGVRNGGGIWETPAIDPALGLIYVSCANPTPDMDGSARKGINLFTNSIVAIELNTGKLKWFYQQVHHDLWDYDSASSPILFDFQKGGRTVKAVAEANKNGYIYVLDRVTGQPVNPIVELGVSTASDVPGEQAWPTQPIPFTASGRQMTPFVPTYPLGLSAADASRVIPEFTPFSAQKELIQAPGILGGANFSPMAYSTKTGLLYVAGIDLPSAGKVTPVGATLKPPDSSIAGTLNLNARPGTGTVSAYNPATMEMVWQAQTPTGYLQCGLVATAGNLIFTGDTGGFFYAFDARTGERLFSYNTGARIASAPSVFQLNGEQFITVASGTGGTGDSVMVFALPKQ